MLIIYKSNDFQFLLRKIYYIIQTQPLNNIFQKEIIIHDNKILFQYLNMFIAKKIGISAHFKLYHPYVFMWKLFKIIYPKKNIKNMFTPSILTWNIMKILDKNIFFHFSNTKKDTLKKFQLAFFMANMFEKYLIYRPSWINQWEQNKHIKNIDKKQLWQIKMWQEIIRLNKEHNQSIWHFPHFFSYFQSDLHSKNIKNIKLPDRIFVISSFSLSPSYIKIFEIISKYIHVYFLHVTQFKNNKCRNNTIKCKKTKIHSYTKNIHPLNYSLEKLWGQYEKIYLLNINNIKNNKVIHYVKNYQETNLLNQIKNTILSSCYIQKNLKKKY
jgi:exodeoxyribonuclease V gamma subunit